MKQRTGSATVSSHPLSDYITNFLHKNRFETVVFLIYGLPIKHSFLIVTIYFNHLFEFDRLALFKISDGTDYSRNCKLSYYL